MAEPEKELPGFSKKDLLLELESLRKERDFAEHIFSVAPLLIFGLSPEGEILFVNQASVTSTGYDPRDLIGRNWLQLFFPKTQFAQVPKFLKEVSGSQLTNYEMEWTIQTGEVRTISWHTANRFSIDGRLTEIICIGSDVTESRKLFNELQTTKERYARLLESVTNYIFSVKIENGRAVETHHSPSCLSVTGYSREEYARDPDLWFRMVFDEDKPRVLIHGAEIASGDNSDPIEHRIVRKDGTIRWIRNTPVLHRGPDGKLERYDGLVTDITERKSAEEQVKSMNLALESRVALRTRQLEALNGKLRNLSGLQQGILDSASYLIISTNPEGIIQTFNRAAQKELGYDAEEIIGKSTLARFFLASEIEHFAKLRSWKMHGRGDKSESAFFLTAWRNIPEEGEWTLSRKDGSEFPAHVSKVPLVDANKTETGFLVIATDISDRKKMDNQRLMSEARLKALNDLNLMSDATEGELVNFALEEGIRLTGSAIGFVAFIRDNERTLSMHSYSTEALKDCQMELKSFDLKVNDLGLLAEPLRTRKPVIVNDFPLAGMDRKLPEGHVAIQKYLGIPIFDGEKIVIVVGVANKIDLYDESDVTQLTLLLTGVWRIFQRKRLENEVRQSQRAELEIASQIQQTLLMGKVPRRIPGAKIAALSLPSHVVDGDFFDFFTHNRNCFDLIFGDVMGKGVPAALLGAAAKSQFQRTLARLLALSGKSGLPGPEELIARVHSDMTPYLGGLDSFISMHFARFDLREMQLSLINCGHTLLIRFNSLTRVTELIPNENMPLGLNEREVYCQKRFSLVPGDFFLFYSDGATEAKNSSGEFFGLDRLLKIVHENSGLKPHEVIKIIKKEISEFTENETISDDLTLVSVGIEKRNEKSMKGVRSQEIGDRR